MNSKTIYALSSGVGRAGIAVIRISGPAAGQALARLTGLESPEPRRMRYVAVVDPASGETIDRGLAVWFAKPASETGEDMAELHIHGGRATVGGVLAALAAVPGLRLAEPGEFARRSFENGKLDLTAAEGVADLVNAETAAQRRQALRQLDGELGRLYEGWRERLLKALAHLEAAIDFSDEDLPAGIEARVRLDAAGLDQEIGAHLADGRRGERLRDGLSVAIVGPPNSGKSSILNRLSKKDAAIVAAVAGTTRDVIEVHMDLRGYPLIVADTAGIRDSSDEVEREGIRRAQARAASADLKIAVFDATVWPAVDGDAARLVDENTLVVLNKSDLAPPRPPLEVKGRHAFPVSALTGAGFDLLMAALEREAAERLAVSASPALTRERHRRSLEECRASLGRFLASTTVELSAEDLRLAARALGRITGRVGVEDLLDVIFRDFCIGK